MTSAGAGFYIIHMLKNSEAITCGEKKLSEDDGIKQSKSYFFSPHCKIKSRWYVHIMNSELAITLFLKSPVFVTTNSKQILNPKKVITISFTTMSRHFQMMPIREILPEIFLTRIFNYHREIFKTGKTPSQLLPWFTFLTNVKSVFKEFLTWASCLHKVFFQVKIPHLYFSRSCQGQLWQFTRAENDIKDECVMSLLFVN